MISEIYWKLLDKKLPGNRKATDKEFLKAIGSPKITRKELKIAKKNHYSPRVYIR